MPDRIEDLPPAESFLRLAKLGHQVWNRWLRTELERHQWGPYAISMLQLQNHKALEQQELERIQRELRLDRIPRLVQIGPMQKHTVDFRGADFSRYRNENDFAHFVFPNDTRFDKVEFGNGFTFFKARFGDSVSFVGATFGIRANFSETLFGDLTTFDSASFGYDTTFTKAAFGDFTYFSHCSFGQDTSFENAIFGDRTDFENAKFLDSVSFRSTEEYREPLLILDQTNQEALHQRHNLNSSSQFREISFAETQFGRRCVFSGRKFVGTANFRGAVFLDVPEFADTNGHGFIDPHGMSVSYVGSFRVSGDGEFGSEIAARTRRLRKIMADIHAQDVERDLFILEREAETGLLWKQLRADKRDRSHLGYSSCDWSVATTWRISMAFRLRP